jgi:hypothetical protein
VEVVSEIQTSRDTPASNVAWALALRILSSPWPEVANEA